MKNFQLIKLALSGWLICASLIIAKAQITDITLKGTTDSVAYEGDTVRVPVIISTSGLSAENILSFRLEFNSSNKLRPVGYSTANTLVEDWMYNISKTGDFSFVISAAGASPIALDSGAILWIDYELQDVTYNQESYYDLKSNGNNYFNEDGYTISMNPGNVMILDRPSISLSLNSSVIIRGDSTQIRASGGTAPYTFSSSDTNLGEITSSNYIKGLAPGLLKVNGEDANGLKGSTPNLEVRGFKIYPTWPVEDFYEGDTVVVSINTTTLAGLNVLSGKFTTYFGGLRVLRTIKTGTLLDGKNVEIKKSSTDPTADHIVSFASSDVIEGPGELIKFEVVVNQTTSSVYANVRDNIVFNEDLLGVNASSSISVNSLPSPSLSTAASIPSPILSGATIDFNATSGQEPYTWSLSDPSIATIDADGIFTAVKSGNVKVKVTDVNGKVAESSNLRLYDGRVYVKSEVAVYGSEHLLPIMMADLPSGTSFSAYDLQVNIDTSKISFVEVLKAGTLSENFSIVTNQKDPRNIRIVAAANTAVNTAGILFYLKIKLKDSFLENYTNVYLSNVMFNEGKPDFHISSGTVTPGPPPPVAGNSSITAEEDIVYTFSEIDFSYSQENDHPFTRVKVVSLPANGILKYGNSTVSENQEFQVTNFSSLTYLAATDESGSDYDSFVVKVGDANSFSNNTGTVSINVNPINDTPRFSLSADSIIVDEAFTTTETVTVAESFAPGEENEDYAYSLTPSSVDFATITFNAATGQVDITALGKEYGNQKFFINADDGNPEFNIAIDSFVLIVNEYNEAPVIQDGQTFSVQENSINGTTVGQVVASDPDGNALAYSITAGNESGAFAIDAATGKITVANKAILDFETTTSFSLTVEVMDAALSASAAITISVTDIDEAINQAPQVLDATFSVNENSSNGTLAGIITAEDPEGSSLTYSITSGNENNTFTLSSTGEVTVADESQMNYESIQSFTFMVAVSDGELSATATITVEITDVNESPELSEAAFTVDENSGNGTLIGTLSASDPDGDVLSYTIISGNTGNAFAISATGEITIASEEAVDYENSASFELVIEAGDGGLSSTAGVTVNLTDIDEAPIFTDKIFTIDENSVNAIIVGLLEATDPEGASLTYTITSGNTSGAFLISPSGQLKVADQSQLDYEAVQSFTLTISVSDGSYTSSATVTVDLTDVDDTANQAPQISSQTFTIDENTVDGTLVGTMISGDPDGDAITYTITSGGSAFAISSTGELTVADQTLLDYESNQSFTLTVQVSDGALTASATITVTLSDVLDTNQAPTIADQQFTVDENSINGYLIGTVVAEDLNGDALSYSITSGNTGAFAISTTGELSVADGSQLDFESVQSFTLTVRVTDAQFSASATIIVNLNDVDEAVNQAPQISAQSFTIDEQSVFGFLVGRVNAGDPDGDAITSYSITAGNIGNAFAISTTGDITVADQSQIDYETITEFTLTIEVSDGSLTASADITIRLNDIDESVNQSPQISAQTFTIDENSVSGTVVGTVNAGDPNGNPLSYSIIGGGNAFMISSIGEITVVDQSQIDFETNPSFALTVQVSDGELTASATITINLNNLEENQAPEILAQTFNVDENSANGTSVGSVSASDPDGDAITYSITSGGNAFAISSTGELTVADHAQLDFETTPSFVLTVRVTDGELADSTSVTINLNDLLENRAPVIVAQTFNLDENSATGTSVGLVNSSDPDGDDLVYSITTGGGPFAISSTGELTVADQAQLDFETTSSFDLQVMVSDGQLTASATITINLNDVDENELSTEYEKAGLLVYPNPAKDDLTIEVEREFTGVEAMLVDISGQVIRSFTTKSTTYLNVTELPVGVYFIKINTQNASIIRRFLKTE